MSMPHHYKPGLHLEIVLRGVGGRNECLTKNGGGGVGRSDVSVGVTSRGMKENVF